MKPTTGAKQNIWYHVAVFFTLTMATSACTHYKTLVVLLPKADGSSGVVTIEKGNGPAVLDQPNAAAEIDGQGQIKQETLSQDEVSFHFGAALAAEPPEARHFTLYFEEGSTDVMPQSIPTLEAMFQETTSRQGVEVQVTGHTDRFGSEADNDRLSYERAKAVRDMLIQKGLKASLIRAVGRGEREPLVPTLDGQREALNRRVEIIVR